MRGATKGLRDSGLSYRWPLPVDIAVAQAPSDAVAATPAIDLRIRRLDALVAMLMDFPPAFVFFGLLFFCWFCPAQKKPVRGSVPVPAIDVVNDGHDNLFYLTFC
jgi:hypothetical protein